MRETLAAATLVSLPFLFSLPFLAAPLAAAEIGDRIRINGYGSLEFEKRLNDEGRGDPTGSFDADGFDLVLNVLASDRIRVGVDLTWEHGPATEDGRGNVAVEYAFVEYYGTDWVKVRAGKMFAPFGIYNEIHTAKPLFLSVKEPSSTNRTDRLGSPVRFYPRWVAGLAVLGGGLVGGRDFDYVVQLSNGDQDAGNPFERDDNTAKAVAARVRYHPVSQLALGASLYRDRLTEADADGEPTAGRTTLLSWGFSATWDGRRGGVEAEYIRSRLDPSAAVPLTRQGLSVMAWAHLGQRVRPFVRYEYLAPDTGRGDDKGEVVLGGVNLRVEGNLFVKAEVNRFSSGPNNPRVRGIDYTEFKGSIAYGF